MGRTKGRARTLAVVAAWVAACSVVSNLDELGSNAGAGGGAAGSAGDASIGGSAGSNDSGTGPDADAGDASVTCPAGKKACGGDCVATDDPNTGCAGSTCSPCAPEHASAICVGGACTIAQCANGFEDCDGSDQNGCEASLKTDPANCGACLKNCALPNAQVTCSQGQCQFVACNSGFADCNANPSDGCETNTGSDPKSCGSCGIVCPAPSGKSPVCNSGVCGVSNCAAPLADCDKDASGTCEKDLSSSTSDCGFCGNACSFANGKAGCQAGKCVLTGCNVGWGECDNNPANGCETPTASSISNCGACGKACAGGANASAECNAGACGLKCNAGFADCDGSPANGCETNLLTSTSHCGACKVACNATNGTPSCGGGGCSITCSVGFGDCNTSATDGCETPLTGNANCGACGKVVAATGDTNWGYGSHTIRRIRGTGATLSLTSCYYPDGEDCKEVSLSLASFLASGDTNWGYGSHTIRRIRGVGTTLTVTSCYYPDGEDCKDVPIPLAGVTASGDTNWGYGSHTIRRIRGLGNTLKVTSCYYPDGEECQDVNITFNCKP